MPQMAPSFSFLIFVFVWFVFMSIFVLVWWVGKRKYSF
uniref:ATP synthase F0 subunit 8 n=1 Tax=Geloina coaxans TaxID=499929 RepID=A0A0R8SKR2_9BIVA|nr:ATP synthase F0 subunit 8 [Geloina coaxans]